VIVNGVRAARVVLVLVPGLWVAGCGSADEPAVRDAAAAFAGGDEQVRCGLLAPATVAAVELEEGSACTDAIGQLPVGSGDVVSVEVWGQDALVHLADDTLFLTWDDGWVVSAAGCEPGGDGPYECQLEAS
jgi:hypothetical protein